MKLLMLVIGIVMATTTPAWSQPADDELIDKAQDQVLKGRKLLRSGKYLEGIMAYERAYSLFPQPEHLFVIARAYGKIDGRCADALLGWDRFIAVCPDCELRKNAVDERKATIVRCDAEANALEAGAPTAAQERFENGQRLFKAGSYEEAAAEFQTAKDIFPDSAKIELALASTHERVRKFGEAVKGYRAYLRLYPQAPDRDALERLIVSLEKRVEKAETPTETAKTESGVDEGEAPAFVQPSSSSRARRKLAWVTVGGGAIGMGLGAFFQSQASSTADSGGRAVDLQEFERLREDFDGQLTMAGLSYGLGGALLATGVYLLLSQKKSRHASVEISGDGMGTAFTF